MNKQRQEVNIRLSIREMQELVDWWERKRRKYSRAFSMRSEVFELLDTVEATHFEDHSDSHTVLQVSVGKLSDSSPPDVLLKIVSFKEDKNHYFYRKPEADLDLVPDEENN